MPANEVPRVHVRSHIKIWRMGKLYQRKIEQESHHSHPLLLEPVSPKTTISKELLARPIHLYWQCVAAYKKRKLSNDIDALNAFSGILQRFENPHPSTGMVPVPVGLPLIGSHLSELIRKNEDPERHAGAYFVESLGWRSYGHAESISIRRPQFPSWS